jgi:hypothetical protein
MSMRSLTRSPNSVVAIAVATVVLLALATVLATHESTSTRTATSDPVLVGAGDIASSDTTSDEATANLLDGIPGTVFTAGDNAYESGTDSEFTNCYGPSWGRHKARSMPSVGNHEYATPGTSTTSTRQRGTEMRATTLTTWEAGT